MSNLRSNLVVLSPKAIRHEELNTESDPCEANPEYIFQNCIMEKLIEEIGCQPYWLDTMKTKFPSCTWAFQLKQFLDKMGEVSMLNERKFQELIQCYKPCTYFEYKVEKGNEFK